MQSDSVNEGGGRFNFGIELARINSELTKCQAWTNNLRRIVLIALGLFFPLLVAYIYLSDFFTQAEQIDTIFVEVLVLLLPLTLLFLLLGGIMFVLLRRISQLEKLADQIEIKLGSLGHKST